MWRMMSTMPLTLYLVVCNVAVIMRASFGAHAVVEAWELLVYAVIVDFIFAPRMGTAIREHMCGMLLILTSKFSYSGCY